MTVSVKTNPQLVAGRHRAGWTTAVALLIVAAVDGGVNAAVARAVEGNGGPAGLGFVHIYLTTVLFSLALTLSLGLLFVPPMFGGELPWHIPFLVFTGFAVFAGLPVINADHGTAAAAALRGFLEHYGFAAFGATMAGFIGAGLVCLVADRLRTVDR